jgi:hypothetical protein
MTEEKLNEMACKVEEIHAAVIGNEKIGLRGLVNDVTELKRWKRCMDLRIAWIAGGVSFAFWLINKMF